MPVRNTTVGGLGQSGENFHLKANKEHPKKKPALAGTGVDFHLTVTQNFRPASASVKTDVRRENTHLLGLSRAVNSNFHRRRS